MHHKPPLRFFPLAALHVAVTEAFNAGVRRNLYEWKKNWMNEECKRLWLRLSYKANDSDRQTLINMMRMEYGDDSTAYAVIVEFERLCEIRLRLERRDRYYKSMHRESDDDYDD